MEGGGVGRNVGEYGVTQAVLSTLSKVLQEGSHPQYSYKVKFKEESALAGFCSSEDQNSSE